MPRTLLLIALTAMTLVVGGYLFAVLVPRGDDERNAPTPILTTTQTIPAEP